MREQLQLFREQMKKHQIDVAYIPTADYHESEYVHEYFKVREWLSGFTGSAGSLIITSNDACLWTDGRYFIQAEQELKDSGLRLMRQGAEDVPSILEYIKEAIPFNGHLYFDGRVVASQFGKQLREELSTKQVEFHTDIDLVSDIWMNRPALPDSKVFTLTQELSGCSRETKIAELRNDMKKMGVTHHVISSLDDIAWLLNIRGRDILYTPVVLSYVLMSQDDVYLYINQDKLSSDIECELSDDDIYIKNYDAIYEDLGTLRSDDIILVDPTRINDAIYHSIPKETRIVEDVNPTQMKKAIKNETELQKLRETHVKDGVAVTKFIYWLKTNIGKTDISELSAAQKLLELREDQAGFLEPSFGTIAGYQEHAAMMHYHASEDSDILLREEGMLLVDSGGQYLGGTTDITRTMILGPITDEQRMHYTTVVRGMLALSNAIFLEGTKGVNLDILARGPLWSMNIDYQCGTGHGVGFMLGVHEGPQSIRWKPAAGRSEGSVLYPGMVVTNEPGVYIAGSHGIRVENELIVRRHAKNEYGQFLSFETMTFAPIDLEGIDSALLTKQEKQWLNEYHQLVWDTIAQFLNADEQKWLKQQTQPIE